jgi:hypothetical protein
LKVDLVIDPNMTIGGARTIDVKNPHHLRPAETLVLSRRGRRPGRRIGSGERLSAHQRPRRLTGQRPCLAISSRIGISLSISSSFSCWRAVGS